MSITRRKDNKGRVLNEGVSTPSGVRAGVGKSRF